MKKIFSLVVAVLALTGSYAQKTIHDANAQLRNVPAFHAIEVSGGIDLYLSSGEQAVAVSAKDNDVRDAIITEVQDGVLKIHYGSKNGIKLSLGGNKNMKAYVSFKTLDHLSASGGCDVVMNGTLRTDNLTLMLSGGCDFKANVDVNILTVHQSGGCDADLTGTARTLNIHASGGCDFNGYDMVADVCNVEASGSSDVNVTVNKEITADASGASDVRWKGNAAVKKAHASGAGSVEHRS